LPDHYRQLLTAYVDGELTSRQRRHVARLLRRSPEARQLLQLLQEDARSLRNLPRPRLSVDLTEPVLRTIAERRLVPGQRRTITVSSASSWTAPLVAWAIAASVLLVLGAASYLYFAVSLTHSEKTGLARNQAETQPADGDQSAAVDQKDEGSSRPVDESRKPKADEEKPAPKPDMPSVIKPPEVVKRPNERPNNPSPDSPPVPPKQETVL